MIFQKSAKKYIESNFDIDDGPVEIVQNYTSLETLISSTGNFSLALDKSKEKALNAISVSKNTQISANYSIPFLANKIFDAMISLYNS